MGLTLADIIPLLRAEVLTGHEWLDREVKFAFGSDLLSDVLAFSVQDCLLLTGITNLQLMRTCEVAGVMGIVLVRGKRPDQAVIQLAREYCLPVLATRCSMFESCGRLYLEGVRGFDVPSGGCD